MNSSTSPNGRFGTVPCDLFHAGHRGRGHRSYFRLGRNEDPDFTVKTMVVQAAWPGATVGDTLEQITDRIESKLQETPSLDYLKSYTSAGQTTIFVYLKDSTPPAQVPGIW